MANYQLLINGITYDVGFEFVNSPSITIKRDDNERVIYEDPGFNFIATGQLYRDLETTITINPVCLSLDCQVLRNGITEWTGKIKTSDIKHTYNSPDKGSYKEVEIIDRNYKCYFKPYGKIDCDIQSPYDLDCNVLETKPSSTQIIFFDPEDLPTEYPRKTFLVYDLLEHITRLITRDNVVFESDYFTIGEGQNMALTLGEWITNEFSFKAMIISWEKLTKDLFNYLNLWVRFYDNAGIPTVRVEEYSYFFDSSVFSDVNNVSDVSTVTKLDKLFSSAVIGDDSPVTNYAYAAYVDFQLDSFRKQTIDVSDDCSFDGQLDLTGAILYDSDKIQYALLEGDNDDIYNDYFFLVQTDGTNATQYTRGSTTYYNNGFLNSKILRRYFDGVAPISVFPEEFEGADYFQVINTSVSGDTAFPVGGGENIKLDRLLFYGDVTQIDEDGTVSTQIGPHSINGNLSAPINYTRFTATISGSRQFYCDFKVAVYGGTVTVDTPQLRAVLRLVDISAGTFQDFTSDWIDVPFGGGIYQLTNEYDSLFMDIGDYAWMFLESNTIFASSGTINYVYAPDSTWSTLACSKYQSKFIGDGVKAMKYETSFDEYPINKTDFDFIRNAPTQVLNIDSGKYMINGYIESLKYDLETKQTNVTMISKNGASRITQSNVGSFGGTFDETFGSEFN